MSLRNSNPSLMAWIRSVGIKNPIFRLVSLKGQAHTNTRTVRTATERGELVLKLLRKEATAVQIAREVGISVLTLNQWREVYLQGGFAGLEGSQGTGSRMSAIGT